MSGPFDPSWILSHLSPTDAAAAGTAVGVGRQVEQMRDYAARSRTIGRATKGNIPIPAEQLPHPETREAWLMGHMADMLPVLGESRGMAAGMGLSRTGHPLMGAAVAGLSLLPMGSSIARSVAGHVAAGAAERAFAPEAARVLSQMQERAGVAALPRITAVDPHAAAHMAKVYESLPKFDPAAKDAYDALNAEVAHQFQAIQDAGHTINFVDSDPYKNSKEMIADVRDNRNLNVFRTPGESFHPYMTPEQNDKFRAVHDWLAHAGEGHSFGPIGEENAYRVHASTLSERALPALATETRGQNSWVNFGPHGHLPVTQRPYAEQKAALWPAEFLGDYDDMAVPRPSIARPDPTVTRNAMFSRMDKNAAKLTDRPKGIPGTMADSVAARVARIGLSDDDLPRGVRVPDVDWASQDLQDSQPRVSENTILKDYGPKNGKAAVYRTWIESGDMPSPQLAEHDPDLADEFGDGGYDWSEYHPRNTFPPAKVRVNRQGKLEILDGNHRIDYWDRASFSHFPAYVVDERPGMFRHSANGVVEKVASAAVKSKGRVFTGTHHYAAREAAEAAGFPWPAEKYDGFVTNTGRFVGRREASRIAQRAAQVDKGTPLVAEGLHAIDVNDLRRQMGQSPKGLGGLISGFDKP